MQKVAMLVSVTMVLAAVQGCAAEGDVEGDDFDVSSDDLSQNSSNASLMKHLMQAVAVTADHYGDVHGATHVRNEFGNAKLTPSKGMCKKVVGEYTFWKTQYAPNEAGLGDPLANVFQCDATTGTIVFYDRGKQIAIRTITPSKPWKVIFP